MQWARHYQITQVCMVVIQNRHGPHGLKLGPCSEKSPYGSLGAVCILRMNLKALALDRVRRYRLVTSRKRGFKRITPSPNRNNNKSISPNRRDWKDPSYFKMASHLFAGSRGVGTEIIIGIS